MVHGKLIIKKQTRFGPRLQPLQLPPSEAEHVEQSCAILVRSPAFRRCLCSTSTLPTNSIHYPANIPPSRGPTAGLILARIGAAGAGLGTRSPKKQTRFGPRLQP